MISTRIHATCCTPDNFFDNFQLIGTLGGCPFGPGLSVQCSGVDWNGVDGMQCSGVEWKGVDAMQCSGVEWNGVDGMQCSGVEWNGMESMDAPDG